MLNCAIGRLKTLCHDFIRDKQGNIAAMAVTSLSAVVGGTGLAIETQRYYEHKNKQQHVADAAGLSASVYMSRVGEVPTEQSPGVYIEGVEYSALDIGITLDEGEEIKFTITYDETNKEVLVNTTGRYSSVIFGNSVIVETTEENDEISLLGSTASVKYQDPILRNPASIIFVLDNSGSMWFNDSPIDPSTGISPFEAEARIEALTTSFNDFNDRLREIGGDGQTDAGHRFLRTSVITYNNGAVFDYDLGYNVDEGPNGAIKNIIPIQWSTAPLQTVENFNPGGGTNSGPALDEAYDIMLGENLIHEQESETGQEPKKIVVFMSDGQNTDTNATWIEDDRTDYWRRETSTTRQQCVATDRQWVWTHRGWRRRTICTQYTTIEIPSGVYEYWEADIDGEEPIGSGWEEGRFTTPGDEQSREACDDMRANNIEVYTIAFALSAGDFDTNDWGNNPPTVRGGSPGTASYTVEEDTLRRAVSLMQYCATNEEYFLQADDADELKQAFDTIGETIIEDVIRLTK